MWPVNSDECRLINNLLALSSAIELASFFFLNVSKSLLVQLLSAAVSSPWQHTACKGTERSWCDCQYDCMAPNPLSYWLCCLCAARLWPWTKLSPLHLTHSLFTVSIITLFLNPDLGPHLSLEFVFAPMPLMHTRSIEGVVNTCST